MAKNNTAPNTLVSYTLINFIVFGLVALLSNNYLFTALDWLLDTLLGVKYGKYIVAIVIYVALIFLARTFLIGSFVNAQRDFMEDATYLRAGVIALIGYIVLDVYYFSTKLIEFSLL